LYFSGVGSGSNHILQGLALDSNNAFSKAFVPMGERRVCGLLSIAGQASWMILCQRT
jgi:hypothetical protein